MPFFKIQTGCFDCDFDMIKSMDRLVPVLSIGGERKGGSITIEVDESYARIVKEYLQRNCFSYSLKY